MRHPIGAQVVLSWGGEEETHSEYFSFGQFDPDTDCDEFGIPDEDIFFYAFEGETQLEGMRENPLGFVIKSWTLEY